MRNKTPFFLLSTLLILTACNDPKGSKTQPGSTSVQQDTFHLFFLGGQSNMEGYGFNSDLPKELKSPTPDVFIFGGTPQPDDKPLAGQGIWEELRPGHGVGFYSDGKTNQLSDRFGPELSFGKKMAELLPGKKIAIVKYAKGGSSIELGASPWGTWNPDFSDGNGINQWDHFLATARGSLTSPDVNDDGKTDLLIPSGIVWMQGESDANHSQATAQKYGANLHRLMDLIRATLRTDDLPVVIGKIADSGMDEEDGKMMDHIEIVHQAQADFVKNDGHAAFVTSTENYSFLEDKWHYTSQDYLDLGEQFATALFELMNQ